MTWRDIPDNGKDVVLRPLRAAIATRRVKLEFTVPAENQDLRAQLEQEIAIMEAAIRRLEGEEK